MKVTVTTSGYHPATGLDLVEGEMDVTQEQAETLEQAGLTAATKTPKKRAATPETKE